MSDWQSAGVYAWQHGMQAFLLLGLVLALWLLTDLLRQRRAPQATASWALLLIFLPWVGLLIYLLIGVRRVPRQSQRERRLQLDCCAERPKEDASEFDRFLRRLGIPGASTGNALHLHVDSHAARNALLGVITGARKRLCVGVYILEDDEHGQGVVEALIERAQAGVAIYLLVDAVGSSRLSRKARDALHAAGVQFSEFLPVWKALWRRVANLRNHRKLVVADARHVWTGGRNIARHYLSRRGWDDLSFDVIGPAAADLERVFRQSWRFATGVELPEPESCAQSDGASTVQWVPSGPDLEHDVLHAALLHLIYTAQRRLWFISPYFVPDEALQTALLTATRSGVDVRILVPHRSDNALVDLVRSGYLRELQAVGAKVFRYVPRMLHSKAWIADNIAAVGSANLDCRSLMLNFEVMGFFERDLDVAAVVQHFNTCCERSKRGIRAVGLWRETWAGALRLLAPLL